MRRRPYGLSYDGTPSIRLQGKLRLIQARHNVPNQSGNEIKSHSNSGGDRMVDSQSVSDECKEDLRLNSQPNDNTLIKDELSYVQKFLNLGTVDCHLATSLTLRNQKQSSEEYEVIGKAGLQRMSRAGRIELKLAEERPKYACFCGKQYNRKQTLRLHSRKHGSIEGQASSRPKRKKIDKDWTQRILEVYNRFIQTYQDSFFVQQLKGKTIELNLELESQVAVLEFYQFFQYNNECHQQIKQSLMFFLIKLKEFVNHFRQIKKIWTLKFDDFGLVTNLFFGWLQPKPVSIFGKQMLLIFTQWCSSYQFTTDSSKIAY